MSAFTVDHKAAGEESGTIKFTNTVYDLGGHYSNTSGQFKAEYPGVYAFFLHIYKNYGTSLAKCNIRKNGVNMAYVESLVDGGLSDSNFESSKSLMLQLAKDDIVDVGDCSAVDTFLGGPHTIFSGFLLYLKEETVN